MAGVKMEAITVTATTYPTDPQLTTPGGMRGSVAAIHMSPLGPDIYLSVDGVTDALWLKPTVCPSGQLEMPYYDRVWARLGAAGVAIVQATIEGV